MSPRTLAKRIEARSWKLKDKLIDMHHQAKGAGLNDLSYELAGAFMQMDEVIEACKSASPSSPLPSSDPSGTDSSGATSVSSENSSSSAAAVSEEEKEPLEERGDET